MKAQRSKHLFFSIAILLALLLAASAGGAPARAEPQAPQATKVRFLPLIYSDNIPRFAAAINYYLPYLSNSLPITLNTNNVFGVETSYNSGKFDYRLKEIGVYWTRDNTTAIFWPDIEPNEGERRWDALSVAVLDAQLSAKSNLGLQTIQIVRGTPVWASKIEGQTKPNCGPIRQDKFYAFGLFMRDIVRRYSAPPYNVKYWEIGNEPDAWVGHVGAQQIFGCWGNPLEPFYGGSYYGQMLKYVYPFIKESDPEARVLIGGLLLDCDPINKTPDSRCYQDSGAFFEGILNSGAADSFDIVNFHSYDFAMSGAGSFSNANWLSDGFRDGPVIKKKVEFLRNIMARYNVNKPLINTESAVICLGCRTTNAEYETTKAIYVTKAYAMTIALGLAGNVWYSLTGWNQSYLVTDKDVPAQAFYALNQTRKRLQNAKFSREINEFGSDLKGYEFIVDGKKIWLVWLPTYSDLVVRVNLPATPIQGHDMMGTPISVDQSMVFRNTPVYLEMP